MDSQNNKNNRISKKNWNYFLLIESFLGLIALIWIALIPKDIKNSFLFGYSPYRLLIMFIHFILFSISIIFIVGLRIKNNLCNQIIKKIENIQTTKKIKIIAFGLLSIDTIYLILFSLIRNPALLIYLVRFQPLIIWQFFSCINIIIFFVVTEWKLYRNTLKLEKRVQRILACVIFIFFLLFCLIYFTNIGFITDIAYWDTTPPVPILEWQIILLLLVATFILLIHEWNKPSQSKLNIYISKRQWLADLVIFLLLWSVTFYFWNSQPIPNSYFTPSIKPPNFEKYPFSDARIYDSNSLSILNGNMAQDEYVIRKPLYSIFLTFLHLLGGQKYEIVVLLQTIMLALIPALIYLIGVCFNNRIMGLVLGVSLLFREFNTLSVASLITTSNSKLLMTELPTILILSILLLVIIKWHKSSNKKYIYALIVGGVLGFLVLMRSQSLILIPFIVLIILIALIKNWKQFFIQSFLLLLGLFLIISPWLYRNYKISGQIVFDDKTNTSDMVNRILGKPVASYQGISVLNDEDRSMFAQVVSTIISHPVETLQYMGNHLVNNLFSSLQILPLRLDPIKNLDNLFTANDLFWVNQNKSLNVKQVILLSTFLLFIIQGIVCLYTSYGLMGLTPLIIFLGYCFSSAITRISGWRFTIPIDWIVLLYFWVGLIESVKYCLRILNIRDFEKGLKKTIIDNGTIREFNISKNRIFLFIIILLLCGLSLPLFIYYFSGVYTNQSRINLTNKINLIIQNSNTPIFIEEKISSILNDGSTMVEEGVAYYPRYYDKGEGEPINQDTIYFIQQYPRLLFYFIGNRRTDVMLRITNSPEVFPNSSNVIIVTKTNESYDEAYFIIVKTDKYYIYMNDEYNQPCLINSENPRKNNGDNYLSNDKNCLNHFYSYLN